MPDQSGRTAVVTGATSGLGLVVARELATKGAHVIMAVRDLAKAERVRNDLLRSGGVAGSFEPREVDLLDLDSVQRFATGMRASPSVDLLVNNAGVGGGARTLGPQGYERTWATNFLGPFALTGLLLGQLGRGTPARVVHVGSNAYNRIKVELPLDDPAAEKAWSPGRAYVASKLANLMFGAELQRRLQATGSPVHSLLAHPGVANTPMQQSAESRSERALARLLNLTLGRSADAGAIPLLYAATAPAAPTGVFLGPSLLKRDLRVHAQPLRPPANDVLLAQHLWATAERLTGVTIQLPAAEPRQESGS